MAVNIGILGLPNVGKSTLFNAITESTMAAAENFPFCTIEPNKGIVEIPDHRLIQLSKIYESEKVLHSTIEFVDIAGLVKGASKGEGLGNKFLSHVREASALVHMVRCFDDDNVTHVSGKVDPIDDIETIELELILADLEMANKGIDNQKKKIKTQDKDELKKLDLLTQCKEALEKSQAVSTLSFNEDELNLLKQYTFLTQKPMIYVANISENDLESIPDYCNQVKAYAEKKGAGFLIICAKLELELASLSKEDAAEFMNELGIQESGLSQLAKAGFDLLGLHCYFTCGPKETRSWTLPKGSLAPQAAGVIHTDFEKGFIRANVLTFDEFINLNGFKAAKESGKLRQEGKDYVVQDGDVLEFLFNV